MKIKLRNIDTSTQNQKVTAEISWSYIEEERLGEYDIHMRYRRQKEQGKAVGH